MSSDDSAASSNHLPCCVRTTVLVSRAQIQFPQEYEKYLRASESKLRRLPKPSLRKMIDVEVSYTFEEMLRLLGFEVDYSFIRSGHQFSLGPHGRTTIRISEIHRFQKDTNPNQQQAQKPTSKLEVDAQVCVCARARVRVCVFVCVTYERVRVS